MLFGRMIVSPLTTACTKKSTSRFSVTSFVFKILISSDLVTEMHKCEGICDGTRSFFAQLHEEKFVAVKRSEMTVNTKADSEGCAELFAELRRAKSNCHGVFFCVYAHAGWLNSRYRAEGGGRKPPVHFCTRRRRGFSFCSTVFAFDFNMSPAAPTTLSMLQD